MLTISERNVRDDENEREAGTTGFSNLYPCDNTLLMGNPDLSSIE
jgi:hypothetical protein